MLTRIRPGVFSAAVHLDRSILFVVFDRVSQQVDEDLLNPDAIGQDKTWHVEPGNGHADAVLLRLWFDHTLAFKHDFGQRHRLS